MTDKEKILANIEFLLNETNYEPFTDEVFGRIQSLKELKSYIDSLQEEPVSEELKKFANESSIDYRKMRDYQGLRDPIALNEVEEANYNGIMAGAQWQKEHLWKSADGDDLPEYEREVVVFTQIFPDDAEMMRVAIGHRPNPEGWDGKSLSTGKVEHYTPKTYDKGGWNIPNVKYWLDCLIPKEIEL